MARLAWHVDMLTSMEDLGAQISYLVLERGVPVFSSDGERLGKVVRVQRDIATHIFDGIVFATGSGIGGRRFVDAPEVGEYPRARRDPDDRRRRSGRSAESPRRHVGSATVKRLTLIFVACLALAVAGCGDDDSTTESSESTQATTTETTQSESTAPKQAQPAANKTKPKVTVPSGPPPKQLEIEDIEEGSGATAKAGDTVSVQYVGVGYESGEEFDASWDRGEPYPFQLGAGMVIPGWDQGVEGMKVGGRRELIIPPELAYGEAGSPPAIGPNETLIFVIDLLAVE